VLAIIGHGFCELEGQGIGVVVLVVSGTRLNMAGVVVEVECGNEA
jgi:hypothetical protein